MGGYNLPKTPTPTGFRPVDKRPRQVLGAVIREYIATAEPVASTQLVRGYRLDVSPATVRNELAALEEAGLLTHPHTSAGRGSAHPRHPHLIQKPAPPPPPGPPPAGPRL